jgi:hypothetical protein
VRRRAGNVKSRDHTEGSQRSHPSLTRGARVHCFFCHLALPSVESCAPLTPPASRRCGNQLDPSPRRPSMTTVAILPQSADRIAVRVPFDRHSQERLKLIPGSRGDPGGRQWTIPCSSSVLPLLPDVFKDGTFEIPPGLLSGVAPAAPPNPFVSSDPSTNPVVLLRCEMRLRNGSYKSCWVTVAPGAERSTPMSVAGSLGRFGVHSTGCQTAVPVAHEGNECTQVHQPIPTGGNNALGCMNPVVMCTCPS